MVHITFWKKTGHWDNYKDNMFFTESENREYALKPMNCPGHVQIYNTGLHSYRDLPLRYGEFGQCHRNETSGALHGIMRVRGFTQDDGHIFCTEAQIQAEVAQFHALANKVYSELGFIYVAVKLALRPDNRIDSDDAWDKTENAIREAIRASGVEWGELPGEGTFYGPKIEYHLKDSIGRSWQCGTMQVDAFMPERLDATYVDEHDQRKTPVMLHRAIVGSLERFIGILIKITQAPCRHGTRPCKSSCATSRKRKTTMSHKSPSSCKPTASACKPTYATKKSPTKSANTPCKSRPTSLSSATKSATPNPSPSARAATKTSASCL